MKTRVLRLLQFVNSSKSFASSLEGLILRDPLTRSPLAQFLPVFQSRNGFSSTPRKPRRGREGIDEESEDYFLRNLDFGGDVNEDEKVKQENQGIGDKRHSIRYSRGIEGVDDKKERFFSSHPPSDRIPNRPIRERRMENTRLPQSSDLGDLQSALGEDRSVSKSSWKEQASYKDSNVVKDGDEEKEKKDNEDTSDDGSVLSETSPQDADQIFKKMKETGLIPNAVAMLDGLCKDGLTQEAMKLFGTMREKGTIPEVVIYTAVVEGFCKAKKFEDAKRIFEKMKNNQIEPNAFSYQVIVQGLYKGKRLEESVQFCLDMLSNGHRPNIVTFTGLVDAICKEKGVEGAEKAIRKLREAGLLVDEKAVRDHLDRKGPFSPLVQEAIFGTKSVTRIF